MEHIKLQILLFVARTVVVSFEDQRILSNL
jgi:hypothetical protein